MKMLKKLTTLLLSTAFLCAMVLTPSLVSRADGPVTWYITYSGGKWYGSSNQINYWTDAALVSGNMKDGDHIVINADNATTELLQYKVDKRIGELAVTNGAFANVEAPYVERAYVAGRGSTLIVTAPRVNNVEIWPGQTIQINGSVTDFVAHYEFNGQSPVFAVTGTVDAANVAYDRKVENSGKRIYGLAAGTLKSDEEGLVNLKESEVNTTPTAAPSTGTNQKSSDSASSGKQLDKVPQTGAGISLETYIFGGLALLFAAAAVMVGFTAKKDN